MSRVTLATREGALDVVDRVEATAADRAFRIDADAALSRVAHAIEGSPASLVTLLSSTFFRVGGARALLEALRELIDGGEILAVAWPGHVPVLDPANVPLARRPSGAVNATTGLSFYEVVLLDELETPLAGVELRLTTPAGPTKRTTDANGRVRVDGVPPGFGHAELVSLEQLAEVMAGRERGARRQVALPEGEPWHVRTATQVAAPVLLPDAEPQKLLLVTRTDLVHSAHVDPWVGGLTEVAAGPWAFVQDALTRLGWHSDALGRVASIAAVPPELPPAPPPATMPSVSSNLWIAPDVYVVQSGDTLVRIAERYLGDGARWHEIWVLNRDRFVGRSPDVIFPGDTFVMPPEAVPSWVALPRSTAAVPPPPAAPARWVDAAIDEVHDLLFSGSFDAAWRVLESIPLDPAPIAVDPSAPVVEEVVFRETMVELALEGRLDLPPPETEQV